MPCGKKYKKKTNNYIEQLYGLMAPKKGCLHIFGEKLKGCEY
jgi:hypothetical protein